MEIPDSNSRDVTITKEVAGEGRECKVSQRFFQSQIPQRPTLEQLYLRDKEKCFQNTSITLTRFFEILKQNQTIQKKLTPINLPDPA